MEFRLEISQADGGGGRARSLAGWAALAAATGLLAGAALAWAPRLLAAMPEELLLFPGLCH